MDKNTLNLVWNISLIVTVIASFMLAGTELFDFDLSDTVTRILGVIDLIAIPVLAYTTVKKAKSGE